MQNPRFASRLSAVAGGMAAALAALALVLMPAAGTAQDATVKKVPVVESDRNSGKQMFTDYCAPCHGKDGTGNGPAGPAMKKTPANLAALRRNNGGKYPAAHVAAVLTFGDEKAAHGSKEMPVWGQLFQSLNWSSSTKELEAKQRINRLNGYIESLQAK